MTSWVHNDNDNKGSLKFLTVMPCVPCCYLLQVSLDRGENVIMCIFMPNVTPDQLPGTLRMIVKKVTCLKWCPDPKVERVFWLKLQEGLEEVGNFNNPHAIL